MTSYECFLDLAELLDDNQELMAKALINFTSIDTMKNYRPVRVHEMVENFNHQKLQPYIEQILKLNNQLIIEFKIKHSWLYFEIIVLFFKRKKEYDGG